MKAIFIGKNKSLGLDNSQEYNIEAIPCTTYPILLEIREGNWRTIRCPYSSLEAFLRNWKIV